MKKHLTRNLRCLGFDLERFQRTFHIPARGRKSPLP